MTNPDARPLPAWLKVITWMVVLSNLIVFGIHTFVDPGSVFPDLDVSGEYPARFFAIRHIAFSLPLLHALLTRDGKLLGAMYRIFLVIALLDVGSVLYYGWPYPIVGQLSTLGSLAFGSAVFILPMATVVAYLSRDWEEGFRVHVETDINAPAEQVWDVLAHRFETIDEWSSTVESSSAVVADELPAGLHPDPRAPVAARQTTSAFATLREVLTAFDDEGMQFTFAALDLPFFMDHAINTTRVESTGSGSSRVVFDVRMRLRGPFALFGGLMRSRFGRAMRAVQDDLKGFVEQGARLATN